MLWLRLSGVVLTPFWRGFGTVLDMVSAPSLPWVRLRFRRGFDSVISAVTVTWWNMSTLRFYLYISLPLISSTCFVSLSVWSQTQTYFHTFHLLGKIGGVRADTLHLNSRRTIILVENYR